MGNLANVLDKILDDKKVLYMFASYLLPELHVKEAMSYYKSGDNHATKGYCDMTPIVAINNLGFNLGIVSQRIIERGN